MCGHAAGSWNVLSTALGGPQSGLLGSKGRSHGGKASLEGAYGSKHMEIRLSESVKTL